MKEIRIAQKMVTESEKITQYVEQVVQNLAVMRNTRLVYGKEHKITGRTLDILYASIETALQFRPELIIAFIKEEIVFDKLPLYSLSAALKKFIIDMSESGIERIAFKKGVSKEELAGFVEVIVLKKGEVFEKGGYKHALASYGVGNISISKIEIQKEKEVDINVLSSETLNKALEAMEEMLKLMENEKVLHIDRPKGTVLDIAKLILRNKDILLVFINLRERLNPLVIHSVHVLVLTLIQAITLGIDKEFFSELGEVALLHDIGKMALQSGMLKGISAQEADESQIKEYSFAVAKLLLKTPSISKLSPVVVYNHIRSNAPNFPLISKTEQLNPTTSMIALSCFYDNLILHCYSSQMNYNDIYNDIAKLKGRVFKEELIDNFFNQVGIYPPGSLVELDSGEFAITIGINPDIRRPRVEVFLDKSMNKLEQTMIVDLSEQDLEAKGFKYNIVKEISPKEIAHLIPDKYR